MTSDSPIDLVYTWVDDSDTDFFRKLQKTKNEYYAERAAEADAVSPNRFRGLDNLRYSLRSVEKNLPWVRKIYIVTNGQVPRWLRTSPRLEIITHEMIFDNPEHLPTYNAVAIEMHLHKIPELSQHFIYMNDDFFIARHTSPDFFFGKNGLVKILFSPWGIDSETKSDNLWLRQGAHLSKLLTKRFPSTKAWQFASHGPMLFDKKELELVFSCWPNEIFETSSHPFREETDLLPHPLYANTLAALDEEAGKSTEDRHEIAYLHDDEMKVVSVGDPGMPWQNDLQELQSKPARFFCLNDNVPPELANAVDFKSIEKLQLEFLKSMFPEPSQHEGLFYRYFWKYFE